MCIWASLQYGDFLVDVHILSISIILFSLPDSTHIQKLNILTSWAQTHLMINQITNKSMCPY